MKQITIQPTNPFHIKTTVPGDKSISHRAIMFGSLAKGITMIEGFLPGADCLSTLSCFEKLGVQIERISETSLRIESEGVVKFREPTEPLYVGNSGTTIRLLTGILAGLPMFTVLYGDESIARRPMKRVVHPLSKMGASISGRKGGEFTPIGIDGGQLEGIKYAHPVASAQVKSALLLAGLHAQGTTQVTEPTLSRDHTERMLQAFGVQVRTEGLTHEIQGGQTLAGTHIQIPGDLSSAAFLLVSVLMVPGSSIQINDIGLNPTRTGILDVLTAMKADIEIEQTAIWGNEPVGRVTLRSHGDLQSTIIEGNLIPRLIDEIPILAVLATQAEGTTIIKDAAELKVKESNRIATTVSELRKLGAEIEETKDGMIIYGKSSLCGGICHSYGDHRIGMAMAVAGLGAQAPVTVIGADSFDVSFPTFTEFLTQVQGV